MDSVSFRGLRSGRYEGIVNVIDVFSNFSWQTPVETVGNAAQSAAAVNAVLAQVTRKFGADALPESIVLNADNGSEFKDLFESAVDARFKVVHGPAFESTAQSDVELSNRHFRGVLRRTLHTRGWDQNEWGKAKVLTLVNEVMNRRPQRRLGGKNAAVVFTDTMKGDTELRAQIAAGLVDTAKSKRKPGTMVPFVAGDRVRVLDAKYLAAGKSIRSNEQKTQARWSKKVYRVKTVKTGATDSGMVPEYTLTTGLGDDADDADALLRPPQGKPKRWRRHDALQKVEGYVATANRDAAESHQVAMPPSRTRWIATRGRTASSPRCRT